MAQTIEGLPELLDAKQVAAYLKLHEVTVLRFARQGKLPGFKVGRKWRFRASEIRSLADTEQRMFALRFEELSDMIGEAMRRAGYGPDDVERLIAEVREERRAKREGSRV
ncbi:MAG: helix-turn-helix domain-containing protein [Armatimonadota bacterium]